MQAHLGPSNVREPEHDDRKRELGRLGRASLIVGVVLTYWILLAAPWSDKAKAQATLLALAVAGVGALIGSLSVPSEDE
jgi:hypothetical protein